MVRSVGRVRTDPAAPFYRLLRRGRPDSSSGPWPEGCSGMDRPAVDERPGLCEKRAEEDVTPVFSSGSLARFLVLGDSHGTEFNWAGLRLANDVAVAWAAGATAYGLKNLNSASGAREICE